MDAEKSELEKFQHFPTIKSTKINSLWHYTKKYLLLYLSADPNGFYLTLCF